jgi:CAAX protease family protein
VAHVVERLGTEAVVGQAGTRKSWAHGQGWILAVTTVLGLLLLNLYGGLAYAAATAGLAVAVFIVTRLRARVERTQQAGHGRIDGRDLLTIAVTYAVVVSCFRIAFSIIHHNDMVLFAFFALGAVVGVTVPVVYTVWLRRRSLRSLGLGLFELPRTAALALAFAGVQFSITFLGYPLPKASDWVPLLGMALMVGIFETIFFRGFIQGRLEEAFGVPASVFGAAVLYGLYHVGYGMGLEDIVFLFGLGIVYAMAYATVHNGLVLWPLLTPMGSLFAQIEGGDLLGRLPWAALLGFADVIGVFLLVIWRAHRHEKGRVASEVTPGPVVLVVSSQIE